MFHARFLLLAAFLLGAPLQASGDAVTDTIATLDPAITHVRLLGQWKTEDASGRYRAIIRREPEPGAIRFFVQKIADSGAIVSSTELTEVRTDKLALSDYTVEIDQFGLTLFIETAKDGAPDVTYEVFFNEDGSYTFQPASN